MRFSHHLMGASSGPQPPASGVRKETNSSQPEKRDVRALTRNTSSLTEWSSMEAGAAKQLPLAQDSLETGSDKHAQEQHRRRMQQQTNWLSIQGQLEGSDDGLPARPTSSGQGLLRRSSQQGDAPFSCALQQMRNTSKCGSLAQRAHSCSQRRSATGLMTAAPVMPDCTKGGASDAAAPIVSVHQNAADSTCQLFVTCSMPQRTNAGANAKPHDAAAATSCQETNTVMVGGTAATGTEPVGRPGRCKARKWLRWGLAAVAGASLLVLAPKAGRQAGAGAKPTIMQS